MIRKPVYCWIGGARYPRPLDSTSEKKWRALGELGGEMHVIAFSPSCRPQFLFDHARFYLLPALPAGVIRHVTFFSLGTLIALWLAPRVDVFIAQSPHEATIGALAKGAARLLGRRVKLVVESHGDFEVSLFLQRRVPFPGTYRWMMARFARFALRHADALRAVSNSTREQLATHAPGVPIVQFMTWTDADAFVAAGRATPPSASTDVVYAGVLIPRKAPHLLLRAFSALDLPLTHLWLIGRAENPSYAAGLRDEAERLGIANRTTFLDGVRQVELAAYMARARVFVLPSLSEGLPRVIVEAMMCGTPVIASSVSGIPDVIRDGENGWLVPAGDVEALACAIRKVFALSADVIDRIGARAKADAKRVCSAESYLEGYRRLLQ